MVSRKKALIFGLSGVAVVAVVCGSVIWKTWRSTRNPVDVGDSVVTTVQGEDSEKEEPVKPEKISGIERNKMEKIEEEEDILREEKDLEKENIAEEENPEEKEEITEDQLLILQNPEVYTYENLSQDADILSKLYPEYVTADSLGRTMDGRELYHFIVGDPQAEEKIFVNGGIHGREYMTSQLVMKQTAVFLKHLAAGDSYKDQSYRKLLENRAVHVVPMVNPDGVSISQLGMDGVQTAEVRAKVVDIARQDGQTAAGNYLTRWKANGNGVDLNRNFDALWDEYYDPAGHPSSDHHKGSSPGCEKESAAMIQLTEQEAFAMTISYHTQGSVIYWYFAQKGDLYEDTLSFAERISHLTGYHMDANYEALDPAGYKDWAISKQGIPSLTIEVGTETSPVPSGQFEDVWRRNEFVWEEALLESKG